MKLEQSTAIDAPASEIYAFFEDMEARYEEWHPDHISFRWIEGGGLADGAIATFEERIGGKHHARTVRFTTVSPNQYIEFAPTSRLIKLLMPRISFTIEPRSDGCTLTQRITVRTGPIGARLNRREFDAVRVHMREEGANLKHLLETGTSAVDGAIDPAC